MTQKKTVEALVGALKFAVKHVNPQRVDPSAVKAMQAAIADGEALLVKLGTLPSCTCNTP